MTVVKFKISERVWNSFSAEEQHIMRHIVPKCGLMESKAFVRALRQFGGKWSHMFCAVRNGRLYTWSGMSKTWHDIGPATAN